MEGGVSTPSHKICLCDGFAHVLLPLPSSPLSLLPNIFFPIQLDAQFHFHLGVAIRRLAEVTDFWLFVDASLDESVHDSVTGSNLVA